MKRLLATLGVIALLGLNAPQLLGDHGEKGNKHQQGSKHGDNDQGWEQKGGYQYRSYSVDSRPPGWSQVRRPAGEIAECLPARRRSTVAAPTRIKAIPAITTRTPKGKLSSVARRLKYRVAWSSISHADVARSARSSARSTLLLNRDRSCSLLESFADNTPTAPCTASTRSCGQVM